MNATTTAPCTVHAYHRPTSQLQERHHILPSAWVLRWEVAHPGKALPPSPTVVICPTGHTNIHAAIDHLVAGGAPQPHTKERGYAALAMQLAEQYGITPTRTL